MSKCHCGAELLGNYYRGVCGDCLDGKTKAPMTFRNPESPDPLEGVTFESLKRSMFEQNLRNFGLPVYTIPDSARPARTG